MPIFRLREWRSVVPPLAVGFLLLLGVVAATAIIHNGVLDPGVHLITKPFTLERLASKVREVLGGEA